ncbi:hypothetical protein BLNAU_21164 [Blattamonas nauphoetae]|uniref:Uncharacterized protein n=1 Tax=Blattamonas nauphoetae TaxID=2049346 RepID=A0ABQ9WWN8_9EUKA|nr:hypothetical protein BLNAU_21164 [Blattamonas nauphoetae]
MVAEAKGENPVNPAPVKEKGFLAGCVSAGLSSLVFPFSENGVEKLELSSVRRSLVGIVSESKSTNDRLRPPLPKLSAVDLGNEGAAKGDVEIVDVVPNVDLVVVPKGVEVLSCDSSSDSSSDKSNDPSSSERSSVLTSLIFPSGEETCGVTPNLVDGASSSFFAANIDDSVSSFFFLDSVNLRSFFATFSGFSLSLFSCSSSAFCSFAVNCFGLKEVRLDGFGRLNNPKVAVGMSVFGVSFGDVDDKVVFERRSGCFGLFGGSAEEELGREGLGDVGSEGGETIAGDFWIWNDSLVDSFRFRFTMGSDDCLSSSKKLWKFVDKGLASFDCFRSSRERSVWYFAFSSFSFRSSILSLRYCVSMRSFSFSYCLRSFGLLLLAS